MLAQQTDPAVPDAGHDEFESVIEGKHRTKNIPKKLVTLKKYTIYTLNHEDSILL